MIIGIGTDILEIKRIGKILNKHDKKFIKRIYGFNEISVYVKGLQLKKQLGKPLILNVVRV